MSVFPSQIFLPAKGQKGKIICPPRQESYTDRPRERTPLRIILSLFSSSTEFGNHPSQWDFGWDCSGSSVAEKVSFSAAAAAAAAAAQMGKKRKGIFSSRSPPCCVGSFSLSREFVIRGINQGKLGGTYVPK